MLRKLCIMLITIAILISISSQVNAIYARCDIYWTGGHHDYVDSYDGYGCVCSTFIAPWCKLSGRPPD